MELLFRKYFWVINLAFLAVAAFLVAKTVNVFVGGVLAPLPDLAATGPAQAVVSAVKTALAPTALSKITGIELPKVEVKEEPTAPAAPPDLDTQDPVKTGLRLKLVGTLVANRKQWSLANIEDVNSHDVKVYMVSDHVQGAEIIDIERWRVLINNNGRKEFIDMEPGDGSTAVAPYTPPVVAQRTVNDAPPPSAAIGSSIRAITEDHYEIPKEEINRTLSNLNDVAMQARIVPAFKDGVAVGFKLFSIRPDSLYTKIGVQNGDVIRRINGYEINSPDKALEVYSKLKESSRIEIEIDRNGSNVRKTYNVR
jgi:general secretion pathway protein C